MIGKPYLPVPCLAKRQAWARMKKGAGFIYIAEISGTNFVKIGFSLTPRERVKDIHWPHRVKATLLGYVRGSLAQERRLHGDLRKKRHTSGEFYRRSILKHPLLPEKLREACARTGLIPRWWSDRIKAAAATNGVKLPKPKKVAV